MARIGQHAGDGPHAGDDLIGFALDRAVWTFGSSVEHDMDDAESRISQGKNKPSAKAVNAARQRVLDSYLYLGKAREEATKGRFRDPALSVKRRKG